jgi:hypothetical protein
MITSPLVESLILRSEECFIKMAAVAAMLSTENIWHRARKEENNKHDKDIEAEVNLILEGFNRTKPCYPTAASIGPFPLQW